MNWASSETAARRTARFPSTSRVSRMMSGPFPSVMPMPARSCGVARSSAGATTPTAVRGPARHPTAQLQPTSRSTSGISAVAAGDVNTCAVTTTGLLKCWGLTEVGALAGDYTPVVVAGLTGRIRAVASGGSNVCALTTKAGWSASGSIRSRSRASTRESRRSPWTELLRLRGHGQGWRQVLGQQLLRPARRSNDHPQPCPGRRRLRDQRLTYPRREIVVNARCRVAVRLGAASLVFLSLPLLPGTGSQAWAADPPLTQASFSSAPVAVGGTQTCVLPGDGSVLCWGDNAVGRLGDGQVDRPRRSGR